MRCWAALPVFVWFFLPGTLFLHRAVNNFPRYYVQPQWVFDCVNHRKLLPVEDYFPAVELPPHLSPFVQEEEGDYIPPERRAMLEEEGKVEYAQQNEEQGEKFIYFLSLDAPTGRGFQDVWSLRGRRHQY